MKLRRYLAAVATLLALAACGSQSNDLAQAPPSRFVLLDGSTVQNADFNGKVTLVNFWATSCAVCVAEMPRIVAMHKQYQARGFETVAVAMQYDPPSYVVHYAQTRQLPFKVAIDNTGAGARAWGGVEATPTTFVLNKRGQIVQRIQGEPDFDALRLLIDKLLTEA